MKSDDRHTKLDVAETLNYMIYLASDHEATVKYL